MRVENALISRLTQKIPFLTGFEAEEVQAAMAAARARVTALLGAAELTPCAQPTPDAEACAHEAAAVLGVALVPPADSGTPTATDVALAANFACARLADARGEAEEAQLALDRVLEVWPPDEIDAGKDCAANAAVNASACGLLTGLMGLPHVGIVRKAIAFAARTPGVAAAAEAAARVEAETRFLAAVRECADATAQAQTSALALAAVAELEGVPTSVDVRRFVWATFDGTRSPAPSVRAFSAFKGAVGMAEVEAARAAALRDVESFAVGDPVELGWLPGLAKDDLPVASLSACGVLCVGGFIWAKALTVAHLRSKHVVAIACDVRTVHGFVHNGELFVAQQGHATLWYAPAEAVLNGRTNLADFARMSLAAQWSGSPRLDAAPEGFVVAANQGNSAQHLFVDLAAHTSRLVDVGQELPHLGGFTGIAVPGAAWAASTWRFGSQNDVFTVAPDGERQKVAYNMSRGPTVLPSEAAPADLRRALVFDQVANIFMGSERACLTHPIKPFPQSLVRLHRDVFLCWDRNAEAWTTVRIVVP